MNEDKRRAEFIERSGRMRALNYLAQSHPEEFKELLEEAKREVAQKWDRLNVLFDKQS